MLQPIRFAFPIASSLLNRVFRSRITRSLAFFFAAGAGTAALRAQVPASSSASGQTAKPPVAAPGTVAVTPATAAALAPYVGPTYDNRWEVYGGVNLMNGQAGQNLPKRFNMGGAEVMGTYWLGDGKHGALSKLGIALDGRFGAGTTPVISPFYNRVVVMEGMFTGGVQYRGPHNRYAAMDFHALGGGTYGVFDYAVNHYPGGSPVTACPRQPGWRTGVPGVVLQPRGALWHGRWKHRLQRERAAGDPAAA